MKTMTAAKTTRARHFGNGMTKPWPTAKVRDKADDWRGTGQGMLRRWPNFLEECD
jgi:hypothetical protein